MSNSAYNAYAQGMKRAESPLETDAAVLENSALVLSQAKDVPGTEEFFMALNYNQRIWTVLQTYATEENPWPDQIKANMVSLSIFVDKQSFKVMADNDPGGIDVLININRQIAAGFRSVQAPGTTDKE